MIGLLSSYQRFPERLYVPLFGMKAETGSTKSFERIRKDQESLVENRKQEWIDTGLKAGF